MIDFSLSPEQQVARQNAAAFAQGVLKGARSAYSKLPNDGVSRFKSTKPLFETATTLGIIKSLVPAPLGGTGGPLIDAALVTEELFAVEPSVSINLLSVNLGLMPLFFSSGNEELQKEILVPFLSGEGAPLASFQFSEPTGSANYMEKGGKGMQTTARKDGTDWIINGEKIWAGNSAGWDEKGANVQTLFCRNVDVNSNNPADSAILILATREVLDRNDPDAFKVVAHKETPGFTASCGPHVAYTNLRIPEKFVVASGPAAAQLVDLTFTASAAMVGAMGVGIMRAAFDCALKFAKEKDQGGSVKLLERQSVADLLVEIKMRIDTARLLTWKAANALDTQTPGAAELCYEAKIFGSEACVKSVAEAMRVVGISSYSMEYPFANLMEDALVLPIFDGGNQGVRRRQLQNIFLDENYDPWKCAFGPDYHGQTNGA